MEVTWYLYKFSMSRMHFHLFVNLDNDSKPSFANLENKNSTVSSWAQSLSDMSNPQKADTYAAPPV